jgi:hypothetical protein
LFLYDLRLQSATETYNTISRDGISLTASINIRYRLKRESIPQLHQSIGPDYVEALVIPEIGNRMREVISEYTAEDVYSTKRTEIQDKIRKRAESMLGEKMLEGGVSEEEENAPYRVPLYAMLNLIDTLILGIELPAAVVTETVPSDTGGEDAVHPAVGGAALFVSRPADLVRYRGHGFPADGRTPPIAAGYGFLGWLFPETAGRGAAALIIGRLASGDRKRFLNSLSRGSAFAGARHLPLEVRAGHTSQNLPSPFLLRTTARLPLATLGDCA